jgi:putative hydrolase of the HAD superfamily
VPVLPQLDVVLFDLDDTLYSTSDFAATARREAVRDMIAAGLEVTEDEGVQELAEVVSEFSSNYESHFDRLLDRLGPHRLGGRNRAVLIATGVVAYHRAKERGMHLLPDARTLLDALLVARVRMGVVTAGLQVKQAEKLIRTGLLSYLAPEAIFLSDQMGVSKPNPKIYTKACRALGIPPMRALYVGDRPSHDIAPAKRAGLKTVLYRGAGGKYAGEPCETAADHDMDDLRLLLPILRDVYALPVAVPDAARPAVRG